MSCKITNHTQIGLYTYVNDATTTSAELSEIIKYANQTALFMRIAEHPNITPSLLRQLYEMDYTGKSVRTSYVYEVIANNKLTPRKVLQQLANGSKGDESVARAAKQTLHEIDAGIIDAPKRYVREPL